MGVEKSLCNGRVYYIEPNYTSAKVTHNTVFDDEAGVEVSTNQTSIHLQAPDLEDYCIAVDLTARIPERSIDGTMRQGDTSITLHWEGDKSKITFLRGSTVTYNNQHIEGNQQVNESNTNNYWTTAPYEYTTYEDIKSDKVANTEMFGIKSIDIQYNNYMVPEVTIEFVDIKGISLFAAEELRHNITKDGIRAHSDSDIAGSFFKCFFTFPYPQFDLVVKGFYGHPTTYELTCSDFRARFDCNTGNFAATAKFVGYAYSLLNDVTLNALLASPLDEMVGRSYWKSKVDDGTFAFDNGTEMTTLVELAENWLKAKEELTTLQQTDEDAQKSAELAEDAIDNTSMQNAVDRVRTSFISKVSASGARTYPYKGGLAQLIAAPKSKNIDISKLVEEANQESIPQQKEGEENNTENSEPLYKLEVNEIDYTKALKLVNISKGQDAITREDATNYLFYYLDTSGDVKNLKAEEAEIAEQQEIATENIEEKQEDIIVGNLGFKPTVKNITKLVLAHMDTLNHCIYETAREVGSRPRTLSQMGMTAMDLRDGNNVGPFPRVAIEKTDTNGNTIKEDGWLGNLTTDGIAPEIKLVHGLLNGTNEMARRLTKVAEEMEGINSSDSGETSSDEDSGNAVPPRSQERVPGAVTDFATTHLQRIGAHKINFNDKSSVAGEACFAAMGSLGLNPTNNNYTRGAESMGGADALNFAKHHQIPSQTFKDSLDGGTFTEEDILNCVLGKDGDKYKVGGKYAWNSNGGLIKEEGKYYVLNKYHSRTLPMTSDWGNEDYSASNIISTQDGTPNGCENVIIIDKRYKNYAAADKLFEDVNHTDMYSPSHLTKALCEKYYSGSFESHHYGFQNNAVFGYKFTHNNDSEVTKLSSGKGTCTFPSTKPTDFSETAFGKDGGQNGAFYSKDFDKIYVNKNGTPQKITRESGSYSKLFDGDREGQLSHFTIPSFCGIRDGRGTKYYSIFGQASYYRQSNNEAKALLFLETLTYYDESIFSGMFKENDVQGFKFENTIKEICDKYSTTSYVPYCGLLLAGAYLWRKKMIDKGSDPITYSNAIKKVDSQTRIYGKKITSYSGCENFFNLRNDIKKKLIETFTHWVDTDFKEIQNCFELKGPKVTPEFIAWLGKELTEAQSFTNFMSRKGHGAWSGQTISSRNETKTFEKFLAFYFDDNFFRNYISLGGESGGIKLYNRESSSAVDFVTKLVTQPVVLIKPTEYIFKTDESNNHIKIEKTAFKSYVKGFVKGLKYAYANVSPSQASGVVEGASGSGEVAATDTDDNIKIALYMYLKNLYDRWLSGNDEKKWQIKPLTSSNNEERSFYQHWHFIDAYYNNIGDEININLDELVNTMIGCQTGEQYSLLTFISLYLEKSRFYLQSVQNFLNMTGADDSGEKLGDLFKPLPYNKMTPGMFDTIPDFVALYTYQPSTTVGDEEFHDDGFDLTDETTIPTPIRDKNMEHGLPVPAFGVSYGMQYQSYFKDINVSMDTPIVTEQAIRAQYMIANVNSGNNDSGAAGRNIVSIGQDLFTIYSNNSYTCEVTMMGCGYIQPLMYFQLNNIPMFHGAYLIHKVAHHVEPGNMETRFTGVRMANMQSPKVSKWIVTKRNGENGGNYEQENADYQATQASIENNCGYKVFGVGAGGDGPTCSMKELNMTLKQYETYKKSQWKLGVDGVSNKGSVGYGGFNPNTNTVLDVLTQCLMMEIGISDAIAAQATLTVTYNKWVNNGKNFCQSLIQGQHECRTKTKRGSMYDNTKGREIVVSVFTKGPTVGLNNKTTTVKNPTQIYQNSQLTGKMSSNKPIETKDLQIISYYACPTYHYMDGKIVHHKYGEYSIEAGRENKNCAHFPKTTYAFQQEASNLGQVYLGEANGKKYWEPVPPKPKTEQVKKNPSELAISLFEAIKQTCEYSSAITCKDIKMEKGESPDVFYITAHPSSGMAQVFDVCLNGYFDYISDLGWRVENGNGGALPSKIKVCACENPKKHHVGVSIKGSDGKWTYTSQYEKLNDFFYMALRKKYGTIGNNNANTFKSDCPNFAKITTGANATWYDQVNTLLDKDLKDCPMLSNGESTRPINFTVNTAVNGYLNKDGIKQHAQLGWPVYMNNGALRRVGTITHKFQHLCTPTVAGILRDGGGLNFVTPVGSGWGMYKRLGVNGFKCVHQWHNRKRSEIEKEIKSMNPQIGDVCCMTHADLKYPSQAVGHACIWNGDHWVSDFYQNSPLVYGGKDSTYTHVAIFRYPKVK